MLKRVEQKLKALLPVRAPNSARGRVAPPFDWQPVLRRDAAAWRAARARARTGPRVLVGTTVGGYAAGTLVESLLAVALTLRGANVEILLCDHALSGCQQAMISNLRAEAIAAHGPQRKLCPACFGAGDALYRALGLRIHRLGDNVSAAERRQADACAEKIPLDAIPQFTDDGLAIGEHAYAGALRYFARGDLGDEELAEPILRRYFHAALLTTAAVKKLQQARRFEHSVFHHGLYVPQGILGQVARQEGVHVVNWAPGYRKQRFIFTHDETYHHALLAEPTSNWEDIGWNATLEKDTLDYLKSRWQGTRDWIWFHEKPQEELSAIAAQLGIDFSRPTIGMLSNVMWDAQLHYRANAFANMLEWTLSTLRYFATRPELQLLIRIHPAEIRGTIPSRQPLLAEIEKAFPQLPANVFVIPPESQTSTYAAMLPCNAILIYGTKTGVELASLGLPVIVAGEAWVRNKGLTLDASSADEYFRLLDKLPLPARLDASTTQRARKYAYHFFFRRMIPLGMFEPLTGAPPYRLNIAALDELRPGKSEGLDIVCDGILNGSEFIYPAENSAEHFD